MQDSAVPPSDSDGRRGLIEAAKALLDDFKSTGTDLHALRGAMKCLEESLGSPGDEVRKEDTVEAKTLQLEAMIMLSLLSNEVADLNSVVAYFQKWVDSLGDGDRRKPGILHQLGVSLWLLFIEADEVELFERSMEALEKSVRLSIPQNLNLTPELSTKFVANNLLQHAINSQQTFAEMPTEVSLSMRLLYYLASLHCQKENGQDETYSDKAIELYRDYLNLRFEDPKRSDDRRLDRMVDLTRGLWSSPRILGRGPDLEKIISLGRERQKAPQWNQPTFLLEMCTLGRALSKRFQSSHDHEDIDAALAVLEETYGRLPTDDQRFFCLYWLTQSLVLCLENLGVDDHHGKGRVKRWNELVQATEDEGFRHKCLAMVAASLRLKAADSPSFIDLAVEVRHQALDACKEGSRNRRAETEALTSCRLVRYAMRHEREDFEFVALNLQRLAADLSDQSEEPLFEQWKLSLNFFLLAERYQNDTNIQHLRDAVTAARALGHFTIQDFISPQKRIETYASLLKGVVDLYEKSKLEEDFEGAILLSQILLSDPVCDKSLQAFALFRSSAARSHRFDSLKNPTDLYSAVADLRRARDLCPIDDSLRIPILFAFGVKSHDCFTLTGFNDMTDLEEVIKSGKEALSGLSGAQKHFQSVLLVTFYQLKAEATYDLTDVNHAIVAAQELREINGISTDHRRFATVVLAVSLTTRFGVVLNLDDLKRAVALLTNDNDQQSPTRGTDFFADWARNTLAWAILKGCRRQLWPDKLDFAIDALRQTLSNASTAPAHRIDAETLLGIAYDIKGDYQQAVIHLQNALKENDKSTNPQNPGKMVQVRINMAKFAIQEYDRSKHLPTLQIGLDSARAAAITCPKTTGMEGRSLLNLGMALKRVYQRDPKKTSCSEARDVLDTVVKAAYATPFDRLHAIYEVVYLHIVFKDWPRAFKVLEVASQILPFVSMLSDNRQEQVAKLGNYPEFPALFCSVTLEMMAPGAQPYTALQNLELVRGLVIGSVVGFREDVNELRMKDEGLYNHFTKLQSELSTSAMTNLEAIDSSQERFLQPRLLDTADQFHDLQIKIRKIPGLEHFRRRRVSRCYKSLQKTDPLSSTT
jgi:tetratricopeptide (TPR) repeat protein